MALGNLHTIIRLPDHYNFKGTEKGDELTRMGSQSTALEVVDILKHRFSQFYHGVLVPQSTVQGIKTNRIRYLLAENLVST